MNFENFDGAEALKEAREKHGTDDPLKLIFCRQEELMEKYLPIEDEILGIKFVWSIGVLGANLDHARDQHLLKARAWWITEELMEALDALTEGNKPKFLEELVDALHFMTELCILSGLGPENIGEIESETPLFPDFHPPLDHFEVRDRILGIVEHLGMGMWQLRNKAWKQTQIPTDRPRYRWKLVQAFELLTYLISDCVGGNLEAVATIYLQKSLVNQFRIRSEY